VTHTVRVGIGSPRDHAAWDCREVEGPDHKFVNCAQDRPGKISPINLAVDFNTDLVQRFRMRGSQVLASQR
jgi:hypothetical protein